MRRLKRDSKASISIKATQTVKIEQATRTDTHGNATLAIGPPMATGDGKLADVEALQPVATHRKHEHFRK